MNFIKTNLLSLLVIGFMVYYFLFGGGNGCGKSDDRKPDTVYSKTTQFIPQPTINVPQYQPIIVESRQPIVIPSQYQLPSDPVAMKAYCEEIVRKYLAQNSYRDSTILRDSAGNNVGVFRNEDLVSENMIKIRKPSYTLKFPHTIEKFTITNPPPLTRQLFLGPELNGNQQSLIRDFGFGAIYKDRKDRLFRASAGYSIPYSQAYFEIGKYWKIKLKN